ncbi:MAG: hypothetical protein LC104_00080, partial [Bacteroidales bacterium]|nr:hypothetical protein [Bacteroidales bacterium]
MSFARVYRVRRGLDETALLLDGLLPVEPPRPSRDFGIQPPTVAVSRLEWPTFESALKTACGIEFPALPVFEGKTAQERAYIRDLLQWAVEDDLLGPADGPVEEIIGMSVRDRYLVGKLAPPDTRVSDDQVEDLPDAAIADPEGDDREAEASTSNSLVPSSLGFTFCVDGSAKAVEVRASWGRYERTESERTTEDGKPIRCWKRIPSGGTAIVSLEHRIVDPIVVDSACPDVVVQGTVGDPLPNGDRLVTLFLVNCQTKPDENQDQAWVFQPELIVRDPEGQSIFRKRPLLSGIGSDEERESLEMIYRRRVEFAVGHGVSVHATPSADDPERAVEVRTRVLPRY